MPTLFLLDKLFADGVHIGLKHKGEDKVYYHLYEEYDSGFDNYKNQNLRNQNDNDWFVQRIIRLNNNGEIDKVIFDRDKDMFPKLKDGMMIWVKTEYDTIPYVGVIIGDKVIYQKGGFDSIEGEDNIKDDIISVYDHGYGFNYCADKPIWGEDMSYYILKK